MRAKSLKWILWLGTSILLIFVACLFVTPPLLNSDFVRTKIYSLVSDEIGAELEYQDIKLVFSPQPTFQLGQFKLDFPDIISIHADRIKLSPDPLKMISGGGLVDSLRIEKPIVRLDLPPILAPAPDPITEAELWAILTRIISPFIAYTPTLNIALVDGSFDLADESDTPFFVHGIDAELVLNAEHEGLNVDLTGRFSNLAFKIDDKTTQLNIQNLSASTLLHQELINLKLNNLSLKRAELDFDGELTITRSDPKFKLRLASEVPDLIRIFPFLRPLLAGIEGSNQVFDSILGGSLKNISMQSEADDILGLFDYNVMKIDARLEEGEFFLARLSHKLDNVSGRLLIAERRAELSNAHLEAGQSYANIEKVAVYRKNKTAPFILDIDNTRIHFDLAALHKNLYGFPAIKAQLDEIRSISGQLEVNMIKLKGPLAKLDDWKFNANGSIVETVVDTPRFPAPITVKSGSYSVDERSVVLKEIQIKGLDANLNVSSQIKGKIKVPEQIETSISGEIGENFNHWFRDTIGLTAPYTINPPISINNVSLFWKGGKNVIAKGVFKPSGGPTISGNISYTPQKDLQVELSLSDQMSHANIALLNKENHLDVSFSGNLQEETINNIFVKERSASGHIEGDYSLEITRDNGIQITASGKLQGENLLLPINFKEPIKVTDFVVTGQNQTIGIDHLALEYGEKQAVINGSVGSVDGNYDLDLDVRTGPLDLLQMIKQYEDMRGELDDREKENEQVLVADEDVQPQELPFSGRIGLEVENLSLKHLQLSPLRADIKFEPRKISAQLVEANLCGIDLLASGQYSSGVVELNVPISAINQDLTKWSICMTGERSKVTGTYDLQGGFSTLGAPEELIEAAQGDIQLLARDGSIEQSPILSRVLSVVNLTEFYKADYLTLDKSKLGYETIQINGELKQGRMEVPKIHFNGTTLEIIGQGHVNLEPPTVNIELLIAPLKTVDSIIKWIPGVNYLLAGNLVTLPVRISGPITAPDYTMIPVGSVGKNLLGIAERVLKLPVKIVEPLREEETENQKVQPEQP